MDGLLNVLKPPGMTSSGVVSAMRRILKMKKIGHTGTLDPGAAGVLPICVGKATRLFDYMAEKEKEYIAEVTLGSTTDTQDSYGKILEHFDLTDVSEETFNDVLARFQGSVEQKIPIYSAIRVDGRKLYQLAYRGISVETPTRSIEVSKIELLKKSAPGRFLIRVVCSKGTYIRAICEDIGRALGTGAYTSFLLRTRTGRFSVADAMTIEEIDALQQRGELMLHPIDYAIPDIPQLTVSAAMEKKLKNGNPLPLQAAEGYAEGQLVRIYCNEVFYGIGIVQPDALMMKTLFYNVGD